MVVPSPDSGEEEVQSGRVHLDDEGTWKGDEMGLVGGRVPTLWNLAIVVLCALIVVLSLSLLMCFIFVRKLHLSTQERVLFKLRFAVLDRVSFWEAWFLRPLLALHLGKNISRLLLPEDSHLWLWHGVERSSWPPLWR